MDGNKVFTPTLSQWAQNVRDIKIEDLEQVVQNGTNETVEDPDRIEVITESIETKENEKVEDPDRIEVITEYIETKENVNIEIKRQDSTPNMFYKVNNKTKTIICVPVQESTIETLTAILKVNLMSMCMVMTMTSNWLLTLYVYLTLTPGCKEYNANLKIVFKVFGLISHIAMPLVIKRKLQYIHTFKQFTNIRFNVDI